MKIKVYNYLLALTACLLFGNAGYGLQQNPAEPVQPPVLPALPAVPMFDTARLSGLSKMQFKFDQFDKTDWNKQTLAMLRESKKMQESMKKMSLRINREFRESFKNFDKDFNGPSRSNMQDDNDAQKVKTYSKSYPADANDQLDLSNSYGRITINTWAKSEVKVDVEIKAFASSEANAQKALGTVNIEDSKEGNVISFKTNIHNSSGSWNLFGNHRKVEINYTVYMPVRLALNVKNSYGGIILPDLSGVVRVNTSYGSLTAQRLSNPQSDINGSYGSIKMAGFNGGKINFDYGNVDVEDANNLSANMSYGALTIGKLTGIVKLNLDYVGRCTVTEVNNDLKSLNINADYSNMSLGLSDRAGFRFNVATDYTGFKYDNSKATITRQTPEPGARGYSSSKTYQGTYGRGAPDAHITINADYGSIKFD